jgi:hypothetical protein
MEGMEDGRWKKIPGSFVEGDWRVVADGSATGPVAYPSAATRVQAVRWAPRTWWPRGK